MPATSRTEPIIITSARLFITKSWILAGKSSQDWCHLNGGKLKLKPPPWPRLCKPGAKPDDKPPAEVEWTEKNILYFFNGWFNRVNLRLRGKIAIVI